MRVSRCACSPSELMIVLSHIEALVCAGFHPVRHADLRPRAGGECRVSPQEWKGVINVWGGEDWEDGEEIRVR